MIFNRRRSSLCQGTKDSKIPWLAGFAGPRHMGITSKTKPGSSDERTCERMTNPPLEARRPKKIRARKRRKQRWPWSIPAGPRCPRDGKKRVLSPKNRSYPTENEAEKTTRIGSREKSPCRDAVGEAVPKPRLGISNRPSILEGGGSQWADPGGSVCPSC